MQTLSNILKWVFVSSADATKVSLTIRLGLLAIIPYVMQTIGITCGLHLVCPAVNADLLNEIVSGVSNTIFLGLSLVASVGATVALIRKIILSLQGQNAAFAKPQG